MSGPALLGRLSPWRRLRRPVAATVLLAFTALTLNPAALAARTTLAPASAAQAPRPSVLARLAQAVEGLGHPRIYQQQGRHAAAADAAASAELARLHRQIARLAPQALDEFQTTAQRLQVLDLDPKILARQRTVLATYRREMAQLLQRLEEMESASGANDLRAETKRQLQQPLPQPPRARRQPPSDLPPLPSRTLRADPENRPRTRPAEFHQAGLRSHPAIRLAAARGFVFDTLPGAGDPAYLAATPEVTSSAGVRAKSAELEHDPVAIYHWVRNHIEWLPTWGAVQDAELTLASRRGNAFDIASLTIALLRASGIPARYVHGTIELTAADFSNWAGGFSNVAAAIDYAASGGTPVQAVISGGRIAKVQLEHIWVEAAVDFYPSRGAVNRSADRWVALDPSYKQYHDLDGLDGIAIAGIDPQAVADAVLASANVNAPEGWVQGFDLTVVQDARTQIQASLGDHIAAHFAHPTVGDVIGGREILPLRHDTLPSGLPYATVLRGADYGEIPPPLRQSIRFAFGRDTSANPIDPTTFPWPQLNNQKVTLSFRPASAADEATLRALLPQADSLDLNDLPQSIPAYLIHVTPELKVNGELVKTGSAMPLGAELDFSFDTTLAGRPTIAQHYRLPAGAFLSIAVVAGGVSPKVLTSLRATLEQTQNIIEAGDPEPLDRLTRETVLGDLFYAGTLSYYAQLAGLAHTLGLAQNARHSLAAGLGSLGYEPKVASLFGIPIAIEPGGIVLNIPYVQVVGTDTLDPEARRRFNLQAGVLSSALEHAIPEQMFNAETHTPNAISAVKALYKANAEGQRIYHLTRENMTSALSAIHHDRQTMQEIQQALRVGRDVITHTDPVAVPVGAVPAT